MRLTYLKFFSYLLVLLVIGFILKPMPKFERDKPRELPWVVPDTSAALTSYQYLDNGQILIQITHIPLTNITPDMVSWFYQHLPISTVQIGDIKLPWYHIFHPFEHGQIAVIETANNNTKGMGIGALIHRKEWFGDFNSQGQGRIIDFSERGMTITPELAGQTFGRIKHNYKLIKTDAGVNFTEYQTTSLIGSDLPIIGPLINLVIRYKLFPEAMIKQWIRHQTEEVASLNQFLPQLYLAKSHQHHYYLEIDQ